MQDIIVYIVIEHNTSLSRASTREKKLGGVIAHLLKITKCAFLDFESNCALVVYWLVVKYNRIDPKIKVSIYDLTVVMVSPKLNHMIIILSFT